MKCKYIHFCKYKVVYIQCMLNIVQTFNSQLDGTSYITFMDIYDGNYVWCGVYCEYSGGNWPGYNGTIIHVSIGSCNNVTQLSCAGAWHNSGATLRGVFSRKRLRDGISRETCLKSSRSRAIDVYGMYYVMYIYIYTYMCVCVFIYVSW